MGHGKGSEMEESGVPDQVLRQLVRPEHHVCAGIPVERKIPVTVLERVYECQRRMNLVVHHQVVCADAQLFQGRFQRHSELVLTDLADKRSLLPQIVQHGEDIAGGSARIGFK